MKNIEINKTFDTKLCKDIKYTDSSIIWDIENDCFLNSQIYTANMLYNRVGC